MMAVSLTLPEKARLPFTRASPPAPSSWQKSLKAMLPESVFATLSVVIDPESVPPQLPAIGSMVVVSLANTFDETLARRLLLC